LSEWALFGNAPPASGLARLRYHPTGTFAKRSILGKKERAKPEKTSKKFAFLI